MGGPAVEQLRHPRGPQYSSFLDHFQSLAFECPQRGTVEQGPKVATRVLENVHNTVNLAAQTVCALALERVELPALGYPAILPRLETVQGLKQREDQVCILSVP